MSDDRNVFRFDLNESLYFEKGQEVSEMIGISLDPEISIQSFDDYISIRGVIELVGEYRKASSIADEVEEEALYFDEHHSKRYIEVVEEIVDNRAIFSHRFPVEISVPAYRIANMNDVSVTIESFDYELPSDSQLIIKSKIDIYGIHDESQAVRSFDHEANSDSKNILDSEGTLDETFEFDVIEQERDETSEPEQLYEQHELSENEESETVSSPEDEELVEEGRWKTKTQTFDEFFGKDVEKKEIDQQSDEEDDLVIEHSDYEDEVLDEEEHEAEDREEVNGTLENVHYLASMFRDDEEEEEIYTKMRLCIVQANDTLEKIAERYKVTTLQLLKRNELEDNDLHEGQLLYIPSKSIPVDYD